MVTGTTARALDQIIITGKALTPQAAASAPRYSVWPGKRNPASYSVALAIGFVTTARASPARTAETARSIDSIVAAALAALGRPGCAATAFSSGTTGRAAPITEAARPGSVSTIGAGDPMRRATSARWAGDASTKNGASPAFRARPCGERQLGADPGRVAHGHRERRTIRHGESSPVNAPGRQMPIFALKSPSVRSTSSNISVWDCGRREIDERAAGVVRKRGRRGDAGGILDVSVVHSSL